MRLLAVLAVLGAQAAGAQVRGTIVDTGGAFLRDAEVQVWTGTRYLGQLNTDEQGTFRLRRLEVDSLTLTVHRIGFNTRIVELAASDTAVLVRMEPAPVRLAPVTVASTGRRICPNREDPRARALWTAMRGRYWQPTSPAVVVFGLLEKRSGVGSKQDVYDPAAGERSTGWTEDALLIAHPELMALSGYATRANGGTGFRTAFWQYRFLDDGGMQDFTGDWFGQAHTLSTVDAGGETVLVFCPRERMQRTGQMEGTLRLDVAMNLVQAQWRFRTPPPDEDAGGEAMYLPPALALGRALLVRESWFWRKTNGGRYYFEAKTFTGWRRSNAVPR
ncbi:carboxypeptidase-like regulatory domain-containing protein [Longimicrobium sp.]|uniref:carboxypeptidase-like regulatory domain-containing protein n=1 Tax=Longimicrobium sp. TaxID=2029185 RepID=UPI002E33F559|nr:carboxypeptidase-like regulatory domain-containing protein [Longimicrobium sp.]HEX6038116.1 carboxypeptidase-like regulatory domain-containing protein [Longimicrobium sp.]